MPPKKKQKVTPIVITDVKVNLIPRRTCLVQSDFCIQFKITLSDKCCNGGKIITVTSNKELWGSEEADEKYYAMEIKALTLSALEHHKENTINNGK